MHDIVLHEELCEHFGCTEGIDIGSHQKDDRRGGCQGRTAVGSEDVSIGLCVGWL